MTDVAVGTTVELAAAEHVSDLVVSEGMTTYGIVRAGTDVADLVAEHGVVVATHQIGGVRQTWQVQARMAVDVYAASYADAWAAQAVLDTYLADRWKPTQSTLRIDSWRNESAAVEQPYPGPLTVLTSIWRVTSRHLPA